jgi:hypothetical protein
VQEFREDLEAHGGDTERVAEICCDMSPAFISGVEAAFPQAAITFDKFHVLQLLANAVDETRKAERAEHPELKGWRYALLRNPETMTRLCSLAAAIKHCEDSPSVPSPPRLSRLLRATAEGGRALPDPLVQLGHSKPNTGPDRSSTLDPAALERGASLVRLSY